jgi:hypothetical protein
MNSRHNFTNSIFLILAFACAIFVTSTETQARDTHKGARLIVQRAPNFGTDLVAQLSIDGRKIADIPRDQHYEGFVAAGRHVLTVLALPNADFRRPTSVSLTVQSGHTYIFTATWRSDRGVVLQRSKSASDTTRVPPVKASTR